MVDRGELVVPAMAVAQEARAQGQTPSVVAEAGLQTTVEQVRPQGKTAGSEGREYLQVSSRAPFLSTVVAVVVV